MHGPAGNYQSLYRALGKALVLTAVTTTFTGIMISWLDNQMLLQAQQIHGLSVNFFNAESRPANLILSALLIEFPLVFTIYQAASKTKGNARFIVLLQVFALSYFCQWLVWTKFSLQTSPMAILLGLASGFAWGEFDRQAKLKKKDAEKNVLILSLKENELQEAHLQLVKQDEADRRILASDLHDQVLNDLKSLRSAFEGLKQLTDEETRAAKTAEIEALIDQTTGQVREVMENLTPSVLENLGLASALDDLLRRSGSRGKLKVRFKNDAEDALDKLSKIEELLLFRTVQESLSNIIKHAQASRVEISVAKKDGELVISIVDDGRGIPQDKERGQSRGLRYMRQRADLMGARIAWLPGREDKGCLVEIKLQIKGA
jgi:signal transduction histidine kinase